MKTILITGISGFVGGHYTHFLHHEKSKYDIHGLSRSKPTWDFIPESNKIFNAITYHKCDLLDSDTINKIIKETQPDYILHLASFSSVAESWRNPRISFLNNTNAFLNIVDSLRTLALDCKILSVGSSEEYGIVKISDCPLAEDHIVSPSNPYAVARVSQEQLAHVYAKGYNLNIYCTRSFNHIGPGQRDTFVVSSLAKQCAEIINNKKSPVITIGDGSIVRDFIDIQDVISAYDAIFQKGMIGETYNICNGKGFSITDIIHHFSKITNLDITIHQNKDLIRPVDNPLLIGNNQKIQKDTGWKPQISIEESLQKILDYWLEKIPDG